MVVFWVWMMILLFFIQNERMWLKEDDWRPVRGRMLTLTLQHSIKVDVNRKVVVELLSVGGCVMNEYDGILD